SRTRRGVAARATLIVARSPRRDIHRRLVADFRRHPIPSHHAPEHVDVLTGILVGRGSFLVTNHLALFRRLRAPAATSHARRTDDIVAPSIETKAEDHPMARIPIIDRADMNAEQARVYDAAKQTSGIVGGPYYAYIRLPKLFEVCQS